MLHCETRRRGFSRVEVLIVALIFAISAGLYGCALSSARETANRLDCEENLRNIGLACHTFADSNNGVLPTEAEGTSVFFTLLPFVEQQGMWLPMGGPGTRPVPDMKLFLCPSRRRPPTNGRGDYGYGTGEGAAGISVITAASGLSLKEIDQADGTANTLLLSHKAMNTDRYNGTGRNDTSWNTLEHQRSPDPMVRDCPSSVRDLSTRMGGPHPAACPSLFCDGHVAPIPYGFELTPQRWSYNDGTEVSLP